MRRTEVKTDTRAGKMVVGRLLSYWEWNFAKSSVKLHGGNQKVSESHIFFGQSPGTHAPVLDTSCIITPPPQSWFHSSVQGTLSSTFMILGGKVTLG